ncbi:hypothetical protein [Tolypothrix sp. VBCCA 56010]|uniref:hypothetical protein n=1 Tax=Tolypothrix sp. VBCCA 56010 TaxID=3137731 RepID=UPI003D7C5D8E
MESGEWGVGEWGSGGVGDNLGTRGTTWGQGGQGKVKNDTLVNFGSIKLSACANKVTKGKLSD